MGIYHLKQYDEKLISFSLSYGQFNSMQLEIIWITEHKEILPEKVSEDPQSLLHWLRGRMIPQNRAFVREILSSQQLDVHDLIGQLNICMGLSVNDAYWVTADSFDGLWDQYNLYDNAFSEVLSLVAFTGHSQTIHELSPSPEMTTNGQLPKTWKREGDSLVLYKGGTDEQLYSNAGKEPYSEYYAAQVAKAMEIDHVPYDLKRFKGILASTCVNFTTKDISYVPIGKTLSQLDLSHLVQKLEKVQCMDKFEDMVLLDAVIFNEDRHYGNFGLLKENKTGQYITLAPLFDHGFSLFARCRDDILFDSKEFKLYQQDYKDSLLGAEHTQLVDWFCKNEAVSKLRKLYTFRFHKHERYNLSDERLSFLESYIHSRARELTKIIERKYRNHDDR